MLTNAASIRFFLFLFLSLNLSCVENDFYTRRVVSYGGSSTGDFSYEFEPHSEQFKLNPYFVIQNRVDERDDWVAGNRIVYEVHFTAGKRGWMERYTASCNRHHKTLFSGLPDDRKICRAAGITLPTAKLADSGSQLKVNFKFPKLKTKPQIFVEASELYPVNRYLAQRNWQKLSNNDKATYLDQSYLKVEDRLAKGKLSRLMQLEPQPRVPLKTKPETIEKMVFYEDTSLNKSYSLQTSDLRDLHDVDLASLFRLESPQQTVKFYAEPLFPANKDQDSLTLTLCWLKQSPWQQSCDKQLEIAIQEANNKELQFDRGFLVVTSSVPSLVHYSAKGTSSGFYNAFRELPVWHNTYQLTALTNRSFEIPSGLTEDSILRVSLWTKQGSQEDLSLSLLGEDESTLASLKDSKRSEPRFARTFFDGKITKLEVPSVFYVPYTAGLKKIRVNSAVPQSTFVKLSLAEKNTKSVNLIAADGSQRLSPHHTSWIDHELSKSETIVAVLSYPLPQDSTVDTTQKAFENLFAQSTVDGQYYYTRDRLTFDEDPQSDQLVRFAGQTLKCLDARSFLLNESEKPIKGVKPGLSSLNLSKLNSRLGALEDHKNEAYVEARCLHNPSKGEFALNRRFFWETKNNSLAFRAIKEKKREVFLLQVSFEKALAEAFRIDIELKNAKQMGVKAHPSIRTRSKRTYFLQPAQKTPYIFDPILEKKAYRYEVAFTLDADIPKGPIELEISIADHGQPRLSLLQEKVWSPRLSRIDRNSKGLRFSDENGG